MTPHVLIVEARFYPELSDALYAGAAEALDAAGATHERLDVPGALEIAAAIKFASQYKGAKKFDGFIALGCVMRGETSHYDIVCNESARGLTLLGLDPGLCIGNGILTVEDEEQAIERASKDKLNKGGDAARTCLKMISIKQRFVGK